MPVGVEVTSTGIHKLLRGYARLYLWLFLKPLLAKKIFPRALQLTDILNIIFETSVNWHLSPYCLVKVV